MAKLYAGVRYSWSPRRSLGPFAMYMLFLIFLSPLAGEVLDADSDSLSLSLAWGQVGQVSTTLTNHLEDPVSILAVYTLCDCSRAEVDERRLKAGSSTELTITYDSRLKPLPRGRALHETGVRVFTDRGGLDLKVTVELHSSLRFLPYPAAVFRSGTDSARVTIVGAGDIRPVSVSSTVPWVRAECSETKIEGKTAILVRLRLDPDAPTGNLGGILEVGTDDPGEPLVSLPIVARRPEVIQCSENLVRLSSTETATIALRRRDRPGPRLLRVSSPRWLSCEQTESALRIWLSGPLPQLPAGGELRLLFDETEQPEAAIPVLVAPEESVESLSGWRLASAREEISFPHAPIMSPSRQRLATLFSEPGATPPEADLVGQVGSFRLFTVSEPGKLRLIVAEARAKSPGFSVAACRIVAGDQVVHIPVFGPARAGWRPVPRALVFRDAKDRRSLFLLGPRSASVRVDPGALTLLSDEALDRGRKLRFEAPPGAQGEFSLNGQLLPWAVLDPAESGE